MMIPRPFTTIYVRGGAPFHVPADVSRAQLESYRVELQARMERLEIEAEALSRGEELPPAAPMRQAA